MSDEDLSAKKHLRDSECLKECQKCLRMIYATKNRVKIIPWDQGSAVHIDEIYTQLSWLKDHRKPSGVTKTKLQSYTEIFNCGKRILVYGRPGIGKTVFTKKAAFDWSQQKSQETIGMFDLVLLIRLRDVCNFRDVPSILKASQLLASDGLISVEDLYDYVVRHQEKVLLILDGYDEYVYSTENQSPVNEIWKRYQLSGCFVIVTSREMKAGELIYPSDAQFEVNGFDDERQEEFARKFLEDEDSVQKFLIYLHEKNLKDLAQIPLLLLILCLVWKEKDRIALPMKRVRIFTLLVETLFDHMREKQSAGSVFMKEDYTAELYALGRLAFDALLQDCLYFPVSKLPEYELIERLIEVGLFQVSNMSSLKPEKGVYFIHKSVQEYLAASFLKEEMVSNKGEKNSLLKVDSIEQVSKMREVLTFAGEWSEEAAREIVIHLTEIAAKNDGLTEHSFNNESLTTGDLSAEQRNYLNLCTQSLFCCSAETRKELFPTLQRACFPDDYTNPRTEHEWPSEEYWKRRFPRLFPDSSFKSGNKQEQDDNGNPDSEHEWPSEKVVSLDSSSESDNEQEQTQTGLVTEPHVKPEQVSTRSPSFDTRPSSRDAPPFTFQAPAAFPADDEESPREGKERKKQEGEQMTEDSIPASVRARGDKALAAYRRALAAGGSTYDKRVKILVVGQDRVGKTSLSKALRGEPFDEAEVSTDGVQMMSAVKNAGTDPWRNPASLERTTVYDYKIANKTAEVLFSTPKEQPAKKEPTATTGNRQKPIETTTNHQKPTQTSTVKPSEEPRKAFSRTMQLPFGDDLLGPMFVNLQQMQCDRSKINSNTDLSAELEKIVSRKGFVISDNEGSGNCMFYALSEQLNLVKGIKIPHRELRQSIVQYLRKNPRLPDGTDLFNFINGYQSWADYLIKMEQDGTWGDHVILYATANCYKTYIDVISSHPNHRDLTIRPDGHVINTNPLVLGHVYEVHYVSLRRKQEGQDPEYQEKPVHGPLQIPETVAVVLEENLQKNEIDSDEKIWPVIWDFAGQDVYRAVHPIFMSSEDIYLLVFDLTKKLSEKAICRVNVDHKEHTVTARDREDTNLDHLLRWMDLIHSLEKDVQNVEHSYPPVILVGTHADCLDDPVKEMKLVVKTFTKELDKTFSRHIVAPLPINNTKAGKLVDQEKIIELRNLILKVANEMPHTKKEIPLQWHLVEKKIVTEPVWQREKYLKKEFFRKKLRENIDSCTFDNEDDFDELLYFLHGRGTIVYYEHKHAEQKEGLIFLDPQWLINLLCKIIKVKPDDKEPPWVTEEREILDYEGVLSEQLIYYACKKESVIPIKSCLISLMDEFNLICELPGKTEETTTREQRFLVPCMASYYKEEREEIKIDFLSPIYLNFKTKYVPSGLFCRLVVLFGKTPHLENTYKLHANEAKFALDNENHVLQLLCYKTVIKVRISAGSQNISQDIYDDIVSQLNGFLERLRKECYWLHSMSVTFGARCTLCIKTTPCRRHEQISCGHHDCCHYISLDAPSLCCKPGRMLEVEPLNPWMRAIENLSKSRPISHDEKRPSQGIVRKGLIDGDDLEELSLELGNSWEALARRLAFSEAEIDEFNRDHQSCTSKQLRMLLKWRQREGRKATYQVLNDALCHRFVQRGDLAQTFCTVNKHAS